ncbi:hypothetical protein AB0I93_00080 [Streptomyces sp. NPDC049967]|uniref:hypothetical protein n=1 Tax=Streptomyces sp. NPDC049967 TaxID=3155658 RepID=UPI003444318A
MTTVTMPTVREAEAAAQAAEQAAANLRAAVENGDATVTPAALAEAEQTSVFARLRIKAAAKHAAEQAEADRHARALAVKAEVRQLAETDDSAVIAAAMRAAADALAHLRAVAEQRQDRFTEGRERAEAVLTEAESAGLTVEEARVRYGFLVRGDSAPGGRAVVSLSPDHVAVHEIRPAHAIAAVVALAIPDAMDQQDIASVSHAFGAHAAKVCDVSPAIRAAFASEPTVGA